MQLDISDIKIDVRPHKSGKDYCLVTLLANINDKEYSESIAVYSKYICEQDSEIQKELLNQIVTKLSTDLLLKSVTGFDKKVQNKIDTTKTLNKIQEYHKKNS